MQNDELLKAVDRGDVEFLRKNVSAERLKKFVNSLIGNGEYVLHRAAKAQKSKVVEFLLLSGANVNQESEELGNHLGYTATHYAAGQSDISTLLVLLNFGADVNRRAADGWYALHVAAYKGRTAAISLLIQRGANVNAKNNAGQPPYFFSVSHGRLIDTRLFVKNKAELRYMDDDKNSLMHSALHFQLAQLFENTYTLPESQLDIAVVLAIHGAPVAEKNRDGHVATFYLSNLMPSMQRVLELLASDGPKLRARGREWNYLGLISTTKEAFLDAGIAETEATELVNTLVTLEHERVAARDDRRDTGDKTATRTDPSASATNAMADAVRSGTSAFSPHTGASLVNDCVVDPDKGRCPFLQASHAARTTASPSHMPREVARTDASSSKCPLRWFSLRANRTTALMMIIAFVTGMWVDQLIARIALAKLM